MLQNMLPGFSANNSPNLSLSDTKHVSDGAMRQTVSGKLTNAPDIIVCQLGMWMTFPAWRDVSLLVKHVLGVFTIGANDKMCRVTTCRIVTGMKNDLVRRNRSVCQSIGKTVSTVRLASIGEPSIWVSGKKPSRPWPALVGITTINEIPEAIQAKIIALCHTGARTIRSLDFSVGLELHAADRAGEVTHERSSFDADYTMCRAGLV